VTHLPVVDIEQMPGPDTRRHSRGWQWNGIFTMWLRYAPALTGFTA